MRVMLSATPMPENDFLLVINRSYNNKSRTPEVKINFLSYNNFVKFSIQN